MKITKKELVRIIEQEVNKVRFPKGPIDQKRLVPDFSKDIPSKDIATGVVELYRSVEAMSTSIMQISARIDGLEKVVKELAEDVKRNRKMHQVKSTADSIVDPDDPYIESLKDQLDAISEFVFAIADELPDDIMSKVGLDIEAETEAEDEEEDGE